MFDHTQLKQTRLTGQCHFPSALFAFLLLMNITTPSPAADWPMWGGDAARTGVTSAELPEQLHLNWVLRLRKPDPAWHSNQPKVQFDRAYEPVVAGDGEELYDLKNDAKEHVNLATSGKHTDVLSVMRAQLSRAERTVATRR